MLNKEMVINLINGLNDNQIQQVFNFAKFLRAESSGLLDDYILETPNAETLEAIEEIEKMSKNPSEYKSYSSFNEILEEVMQDV